MDWKQLFIGSLDVLRNISKYLSYRDTVPIFGIFKN